MKFPQCFVECHRECLYYLTTVIAIESLLSALSPTARQQQAGQRSLLSPICLSSFPPLLYLFPPFFSSRLNTFETGQSAADGEQWENHTYVRPHEREKRCESEQKREPER